MSDNKETKQALDTSLACMMPTMQFPRQPVEQAPAVEAGTRNPLLSILKDAAKWLHAAYDRPPQTPEAKSMLDLVDLAIQFADEASRGDDEPQVEAGARDDRATFEKWYLHDMPHETYLIKRCSRNPDMYDDDSVEDAWTGFQAGAALARTSEAQQQLREALDESQSLLAAMTHEARPVEEIEEQMAMNRAALDGTPWQKARASEAAAGERDVLPNAIWTRDGSGIGEWWSFKDYECRKDGAGWWVVRKGGDELYRHTYLQVVMAHAERAILAAAPQPASEQPSWPESWNAIVPPPNDSAPAFDDETQITSEQQAASCSLGCVSVCKADLHGCSSECPSKRRALATAKGGAQ